MNKIVIETRVYRHVLEDGVTNDNVKVKYTISIKDRTFDGFSGGPSTGYLYHAGNGVVETVWNEYGESIMKQSEAFEYFSNKYNS